MKKYNFNNGIYGIEINDSLEFKYLRYYEPFDLHFSGDWDEIAKEEFLEALDNEIEWLYNKVKEYETLKEGIKNDNKI